MQQEIDKIPWFPEFITKQTIDGQLDPIITTLNLLKDQIDIRRELENLICKKLLLEDIKEQEFTEKFKKESSSKIVKLRLSDEEYFYDGKQYCNIDRGYLGNYSFSSKYSAASALFKWLIKKNIVKYQYDSVGGASDNIYLKYFKVQVRKRKDENQYKLLSYTLQDCLNIIEKGTATFEHNGPEEPTVVKYIELKVTSDYDIDKSIPHLSPTNLRTVEGSMTCGSLSMSNSVTIGNMYV